MQADTGARKSFFDGFHLDWDHLGSCKDKILDKERLAEVTLLASTAAVVGYVVWWAAKAASTYTILGLG
jgi:hypothetical protein